jgi:hypothetical protein
MSKAEVIEALRNFSLEEILEVIEIASQYLRKLILPNPKPAITTTLSPRIPGQDKGKVFIAADFNDPLPDSILNDFLNPL